MLRRTRVKAKSLVNRISGVSVSLTGVGVSWKPKEAERDVVRGLLIFLEDRRALSIERHREDFSYVAQSLIEIRKELTTCLQRLDDDSRANDSMRLMRGACSAFLTATQEVKRDGWHYDNFFEELGALRAIFGQQIAVLAYLYNIDVDENLASLLPPEKE